MTNTIDLQKFKTKDKQLCHKYMYLIINISLHIME